MPYKSEQQRKFFNSESGKKKLGKEEVEHWNEVSEGKKLPNKVKDILKTAADTISVKDKPSVSSSNKQNIRKAIQMLKQASSVINNVAMDEDIRILAGVVNNIHNDISILENVI